MIVPTFDNCTRYLRAIIIGIGVSVIYRHIDIYIYVWLVLYYPIITLWYTFWDKFAVCRLVLSSVSIGLFGVFALCFSIRISIQISDGISVGICINVFSFFFFVFMSILMSIDVGIKKTVSSFFSTICLRRAPFSSSESPEL